MCGIVGLLAKKPALREKLGELMVPMLIGMTERGPDSAGLAVFTNPLPLALLLCAAAPAACIGCIRRCVAAMASRTCAVCAVATALV